ncbi:TolC family protein [Altericroceibacterium endophyticum]|uniref:TolC family protein n=1 Tax=Altericroceibacterium endophyticum TaxID=1808508 RepID=A0A6I4T9G5_9SPHN|nr:TolC family protein [Altericroceibacterium endophyticum]MXO66643.1 hypothetical protein [Altericroceibacterium endophyticum]
MSRIASLSVGPIALAAVGGMLAGGVTLPVRQAQAQMVASVQRSCVTMPDALRAGARTSPEIAIAKARQRAAMGRIKKERGTGLPSLSAYARGADGDSGLVDGRANTQTGIIASQRIYDFGQGHYRLKSAAARAREAKFNILDAQIQSRAAAGLAFLAVLEAQERLTVSKSREARFLALAEGVDRRLDRGLITVATASSIRAEVASATAQRVEQQLTLRNAETELAIETGLALLPCSQTEELPNLLAVPPLPTDFDVQHATSLAPAILGAKAARDAAEANVELARRVQRPTISIEGVGAYQYDNFTKEWEPAKKIGLDVSMPIFSGGSFGGEREEAWANMEAATSEIDRLKRVYRRDLLQGMQRVDAYADLAEARENAASAQRDEVNAVRKQFERGLRPYQDYERAEADLALSEISAIRSRYASLRQRIQVLALLGRLTDVAP